MVTTDAIRLIRRRVNEIIIIVIVLTTSGCLRSKLPPFAGFLRASGLVLDHLAVFGRSAVWCGSFGQRVGGLPADQSGSLDFNSLGAPKMCTSLAWALLCLVQASFYRAG